MNFRSVLIPALALLGTTALAQTTSQPAVGTPTSVQSGQGSGGRSYSVTPAQAAQMGVTGGSAQIADVAPSHQMPQDFRLLPGDLISIRIYGQVDYAPNVVVDKDGNITLPFIGEIHVGGVSILETSQKIADRLTEAGQYNHPQVSVNYLEGPGSTITVVGELHGTVPVLTERTLLDTLSSLGGLPPTASHLVTINRPGQTEPILVDLGAEPATSPAANIPVLPGDTIIIGRAGVLYVIGAFKTTGVFPLNGYQPTTLMQLSASTGGPLFEAKYDDLRLIRTVGGKRELVKLDIQKVLNGKVPDPVLQANDILFLPTSTMKAAIANGGLGVISGLASVAVTAIAVSR